MIEKHPAHDRNGKRLRRRMGTVEKVDPYSRTLRYMTRYDDGGVTWSNGTDVELAATAGL